MTSRRLPHLLTTAALVAVATCSAAASADAAQPRQSVTFEGLSVDTTTPTVGDAVDVSGSFDGTAKHQVEVEVANSGTWQVRKNLRPVNVIDTHVTFPSAGTWKLRLVVPISSTYKRATSKTFVIRVAAKPVATTTTATTPTTTGGTYVNTDGITVSSPVSASSAPSGATAQCNDGTYSFSLHRSGTCSGHGGVATWL